MRQVLPGLQIDHRRGGFLGVTCMDNTDVCRINTIVKNGAAEEAGLIEGDVIVQIGEARIQHFKDLQKAINEQLAGDEVEVLYRRGDSIQTVKVRLRRLEEL
jgi:S1-C subfamily serine protease